MWSSIAFLYPPSILPLFLSDCYIGSNSQWWISLLSWSQDWLTLLFLRSRLIFVWLGQTEDFRSRFSGLRHSGSRCHYPACNFRQQLRNLSQTQQQQTIHRGVWVRLGSCLPNLFVTTEKKAFQKVKPVLMHSWEWSARCPECRLAKIGDLRTCCNHFGIVKVGSFRPKNFNIDR